MQQIASSAHRNLVRCACGKPYGAAAAAAAAAPHEPPPPTDRSCAKGNGMKTNMQIRYTEPAISPIASGTCGPCTGRTSAPLASRFVSGLFRSIPKSRALMNAGRIASVNRDVTTYPRPESSTLTASGGGGQRWPGRSSDAAAPTAAVSTSASSCESGIGNSAAVSSAWRARKANVGGDSCRRRQRGVGEGVGEVGASDARTRIVRGPMTCTSQGCEARSQRGCAVLGSRLSRAWNGLLLLCGSCLTPL